MGKTIKKNSHRRRRANAGKEDGADKGPAALAHASARSRQIAKHKNQAQLAMGTSSKEILEARQDLF